MRSFNRGSLETRPVTLTPHINKHAEGSCQVEFGDTKVIVTCSIEERVPPHVFGTGSGWVTAEYGMLPRSTHDRSAREAAKGKQGGRTLEIQRLIGRSLRACVDMKTIGVRTLTLDCDVIQADGGTRTASITGAFVALHLACQRLKTLGLLTTIPLTDHVAAVSCGIVDGTPVLDLDYQEDSSAEADANFVLTGAGAIVEIQGTAEQKPFSEEHFLELLALARRGIGELVGLQRQALGLVHAG